MQDMLLKGQAKKGEFKWGQKGQTVQTAQEW
jgi:hypothetical protein